MFIPLHDANYLRHIRLQYVTLALIIINCVVWVAFGTNLVTDEKAVRAAVLGYGFIPAVVNGYEPLPEAYAQLPEYATYFTYAFLHSDFWHLAGNMLFIWVFGDNVEDAMGHFRFLIFFLLCAAAGAAAHSLVQPESISPLIGASGAAAGIIVAYVMLHPNVKVWILAFGRIPLRLSALWVIGAWIVFQVTNLLIASGDPVSWAAHVGGILAGAILLPFFKRAEIPLFDRSPVDEVIPPVPPPAVAEEGYPLPGQPRELADESTPDEPSEEPDERPMPWGRQPRRKD